MFLTGKRRQRCKIIPDYFSKTPSATSALICPSRSSKLGSIFSGSTSQILSIIKNVFKASEIRIASLDITSHTNHNLSTPITLPRIEQFPIEHRTQQRGLVAFD